MKIVEYVWIWKDIYLVVLLVCVRKLKKRQGYGLEFVWKVYKSATVEVFKEKYYYLVCLFWKEDKRQVPPRWLF